MNRPLKCSKQYIKFVKYDENSGKKAELHGFVEFWSGDKYNVSHLLIQPNLIPPQQEIGPSDFLDKLRCDFPEIVFLKLLVNQADELTIVLASFF